MTTETETATPEELEQAGQGTLLEERPHIGMPELEPEPIHPLTPADEGNLAARQDAARAMSEGQARARAVTPLDMLASALESGHDVTKLERLFDLAERHEANEARKAFAAALSDFQAECPPIVETKLATVTMQSGGAYSYSYADLDIIMKTIRPLLGKHGLSVRYDAETSDDGKRIRSTCYVMHRDGHQETTTFVVPVDEAMKVNDSQKMGSANSYACRYNVVNALGLTTGEDDDGGSLHGSEAPQRQSTPAAPSAGDIDEFFPIGKHKGKPWDQVPLDYLEWVVSNLTDKPDIVERAKQQIDARGDSDDLPPEEEGELTMAECARTITNAKRVDELEKFWPLVPERHRKGLVNFYETRKTELSQPAEG